jgi:ankyrin repeat protein
MYYFSIMQFFLCATSITLLANPNEIIRVNIKEMHREQELYNLETQDGYNCEKYPDNLEQKDEHLTAFKKFFYSVYNSNLNCFGEAELNYTQKIKFCDLLGKVKNIHGDSSIRFSPLACACYFNLDLWVFHFLRKGVDINQFNGLPLEQAINGRRLDLAYDLINHGADVNKGNTLQFVVCNDKHYRTKNGFVFPDEVIKNFTDFGADFSKQSHLISTLLLSGKNNPKHSLKMLEFLLSHGADPNIEISWSIEIPLDLNNLDNYGQHIHGRSILGLAEALHDSTPEEKNFKKIAIAILKQHGAVRAIQ